MVILQEPVLVCFLFRADPGEIETKAAVVKAALIYIFIYRFVCTSIIYMHAYMYVFNCSRLAITNRNPFRFAGPIRAKLRPRRPL